MWVIAKMFDRKDCHWAATINQTAIFRDHGMDFAERVVDYLFILPCLHVELGDNEYIGFHMELVS